MVDKKKTDKEKLEWLRTEMLKGVNSGPGIPIEKVREHFRARYKNKN